MKKTRSLPLPKEGLGLLALNQSRLLFFLSSYKKFKCLIAYHTFLPQKD